jgi:mono/diheme cytochrome c family protein
MKFRPFVPDEKRSYSRQFFILVILLATATLWSFVDEIWVRRPWKAYQAEYVRLEKERLTNLVIEMRGKFAEGGEHLDAVVGFEREIASLENAIASDASEAERKQLSGELREARAGLSELKQPLWRAEHSLENLEDARSGLTQFLVPGLERNAFGQVVDRVDRCASCHLGVQGPTRDAGPKVFRSHPKRFASLLGDGDPRERDVLLGVHPPENFGCTSCHEGQGLATTTEDAHAWEELGTKPIGFWDRPMLLGDHVEASCNYCHGEQHVIVGAPTLNRGKELFRTLGCAGCHPVEGYEDTAKIGTSLRRVASKVSPSWLVEWLTQDRDAHSAIRMPSFEFELQQAIPIAAYLLSSSEPFEPSAALPATNGDAGRGKELVAKLGCAGCHTIDDPPSPPEEPENPAGLRFAFGPNLTKVGDKVRDPAWLLAWLLDPTGYDAGARMPTMQLSSEEAADITAYLTNRSEIAKPKPDFQGELSAPEAIEQGKRLISEYGCSGCHEINGFDSDMRNGSRLDGIATKSVGVLDFGNTQNADYEGPAVEKSWESWTYHKLANPRLYATQHIRMLMPDYGLTEAEIDSLIVFLKGLAPPDITNAYIPKLNALQHRINRGHQISEYFNCRGCHVINGKGGDILARYEDPSLGPPSLTGEGLKVRSEWLFSFLTSPEVLRPWLSVRMPKFHTSDEETSALVEYFYALAGQRVLHDSAQPPALSSEDRATARVLFETFKCAGCHSVSTNDEFTYAELAPDLVRTPKRLRYGWVLDWIKDPQHLQPGTRMPTYFPLMDDEDPESIFSQLPDVADGDPLRQIELLGATLYELTPPR